MPRLSLVSNPFDPELLEIDIPADKTLDEIFWGRLPKGCEVNGELVSDLSYVVGEGDEVAAYVDLEADWLIYVFYALTAVSFVASVYTLLAGPEETAEPDEISPTYNLRGQSNEARIGAPIPYAYGRERKYPDLAAQPYIEYFDDEQYLYQIFSFGMGRYDISDIKIEDTLITNFEGVTTEVVHNGSVTLFPSDVVTSVEVSNQLLSTTFVGPFVANAATTDITAFTVDVVFPRGLGRQRSSGSIESRTMTGQLEIEYREIDDAGVPVGAGTWSTSLHTIVGQQNEPLFRSFRIPVATIGRYEVRVRRTAAENTGFKIFEEIHWLALRGFLEDTTVFTDMTVLAVRIRSSEQLSGQSRRRINALSQRYVQTYIAGVPQGESLTRNPAWAFIDAVTATWAGDQPSSILDFATIESWAATCTANGYFFDGTFDKRETMWLVLKAITGAGKAFPVPSLNEVSIKEEGTQTLPAAIFSRANMWNETFAYQFERDDDYDSIELVYNDEDEEYQQTSLKQAITAAATTLNPQKIDLRRGTTNRDHVYLLGKFIGGKIQYQRQRTSFETELEGYIVERGDLISVATDTVGDVAVAGEVLGVAGVSNEILTLSHEVYTELAVDYGVMLRDRNGDVYGPYTATINAGSDGYEITLTDLPAIDASPLAGSPNIHYIWGEEAFTFENFVVTEVNPKDDYRVAIEAVNYDARVYDETGTAPPPAIRPLLPRVSERPSVLYVRIENGAEPTLAAITVIAEGGWASFVYQYSFDNITWSAIESSNVASFSIPVFENDTVYFRVAAVGVGQGPWFSTSQSLGLDETATGYPALANLDSNLVGEVYDQEATVLFTWDADTDADSYRWELLNSNGDVVLADYVATNALTVTRSQIENVVATIGRGAADLLFTVRVTSASHTGAVGQNPVTLAITNPQIGAPTSVTVTEGFNAMIITTAAPVANDLSGMVIHAATTQSFVPGPANLLYDGDFLELAYIPITEVVGTQIYVRVALYDVYGKDSVTYFAEQVLTVTNTVELDSIIGQQFGSPMIQNPYFDQAVARSNGTLRPAGWHLDGGSYDDLTYLDSTRDKIVMQATTVNDVIIASNAFSPIEGASYEVIIRARVQVGTENITFGIAYRNAELADGRVAVRPVTPGPVNDPGLDSSNANGTPGTTAALTTAFQEFSYSWTPDALNQYASVYIQVNTATLVEIDYAYVRHVATDGADLGLNLRNEAGELLEDIDVRNDQAVAEQLGAINFNPSMQSAQYNAVRDIRGPAGYAHNGTNEIPLYVSDATRDVMRVANTLTTNMAAIRTNPDTVYEISLLIRAESVATNVDLYAYELDVELGAGEYYIGNAAVSPHMVNRTRFTTLINDQSVGTTYELMTAIYVPTETALWFSPAIYANGSTNALNVEWWVVRERSVRPQSQNDLGGLLFNSWMTVRDYAAPTIRPAGWYLNSTTDQDLVGYQDADQTILRLGEIGNFDTHAIHSTAFQVNPNAIYRIRIRLRGRVADTDGLYIRMIESDLDLTEGHLYFSRDSNPGPTYDEAFRQNPTREILGSALRTSGGTDWENDPVPVAWTEYVGEYRPTSTAKWASLAFLNWSGYGDEIWIDRATVDLAPAALAALDQADTGDIVNNAVTNLGYAEGASAVNVNSTSWQDVLSVSLDLGLDISDTDVFLLFSGDLIVTGYNVGNQGLSSIQLRALDNGNVSRGSHQFDVTPHHPLQELDQTSAGLGRTYRKSVAQGGISSSVNINGWAAPGGVHSHESAFTITVVSSTEFELDEAGTYLILADFSVRKTAGSGTFRGHIEMQDRTSGGSYAVTPGTDKWFDAASTTQYDSVAIHAILNVAANHRIRFVITPSNATGELLANACNLTILQIGAQANRFSASPQTLQAVSTVFRISTGLVTGTNSFEIEGRVLSTSGLAAANFNERKLLAFVRKR